MKPTMTKAPRWRMLLAALAFTASGAASAAPAGIDFNGTLAGGGSFTGFLLWSDIDVEGGDPAHPGSTTDNRGRYLGGQWHIDITGGGGITGGTIDNLLGGRAPVETMESPAIIGMYMLGPNEGELPRLSLLFQPVAGFDADVAPSFATLAAFLPSLTVGSGSAFSTFKDINGIAANVLTLNFSDASYRLNPAPVPVPASLGLLAGALGLLPALRRKPRQA